MTLTATSTTSPATIEWSKDQPHVDGQLFREDLDSLPLGTIMMFHQPGAQPRRLKLLGYPIVFPHETTKIMVRDFGTLVDYSWISLNELGIEAHPDGHGLWMVGLYLTLPLNEVPNRYLLATRQAALQALAQAD